MAGTLIVDKIQLDVGNTFQVLSNTESVIFSANPSGLTFDSGSRIRGDFSNATLANRVMFQTSTANEATSIATIPSGTGSAGNFRVFGGTDVNNTNFADFVLSNAAGAVLIRSDKNGTGTYLPMTFYTGGSERARIATNGDFSFNSGYGSAAVAYGCRAWVNFNGTGTVAIRASGNVSSITDGGAGIYTVNFTTAMPDANYAGVVGVDDGLKPGINSGATASAFGVTARNNSNVLTDSTTVAVSIFR